VPAIKAFHAARVAGKSVGESLTVANEVANQHNAASQMLNERAAEFKKDPGAQTVRALGDVAALVASFYAGGPEAGGAETEAATGETAAAASANEARVQSSVAKAGLEPGVEAQPSTIVKTPAQTHEWAPEVTERIPARTMIAPGTEPEPMPTGTMHEPILQNSARTHVNEMLKEEGLKPIDPATDLRDVGDRASKQLYTRSAEGFAQVEEATGKNLNALRQQLKELYRKKAETFNDPDKEGSIIDQINGMEDEAEQAFAEARKQGVDVDQPLADWKRSKSLSNWGETVRSAVDPLQKSGTFDPSKYAPKLEKLYRSDARYPGKFDAETGTLTEPPTQLEQAFGKQRAEAMRDDAYAASETQQALKNFKPEPGIAATTTKGPASTVRTPALVTKTPASIVKTAASPATESKALYDLVRKNTGRRFAVGDQTTNWGKVYKDFDKLSPAERAAQFKNPAAVEKTILNQARKQVARRAGGVVAAAGVAHILGVDGYIANKILAAAQ
jgi:hypothetical protein